jgi:hypothetical protein
VIFLGKVVGLQVQISSLKIGTAPNQEYDLDGLRTVETLELNDGGVRGWRDGVEYADVHHRDHPRSKLRGTENSISFGFTGHYQLMRERFGPHLQNGLAAENILIEHDAPVPLTDIRGGLVIQSAAGRTVELCNVMVAEPCAPFSRWSMNYPKDAKPDRTVTEALQFLSNGVRGFYCKYNGPPVQIEAGTLMFIAA